MSNTKSDSTVISVLDGDKTNDIQSIKYADYWKEHMRSYYDMIASPIAIDCRALTNELLF